MRVSIRSTSRRRCVVLPVGSVVSRASHRYAFCLRYRGNQNLPALRVNSTVSLGGLQRPNPLGRRLRFRGANCNPGTQCGSRSATTRAKRHPGDQQAVVLATLDTALTSASTRSRPERAVCRPPLLRWPECCNVARDASRTATVTKSPGLKTVSASTSGARPAAARTALATTASTRSTTPGAAIRLSPNSRVARIGRLISWPRSSNSREIVDWRPGRQLPVMPGRPVRQAFR